MNKPDPAGRALQAMGALLLLAIGLWVGVVVIGLYYFYVNEVIPPIVDRIQVGMLGLAALCVLAAVAMLARFVVLIVNRRRAEPPQV